MVAQFKARKPVNLASFTDSFIVSFSKLLKLWSWMQTRETQNNFPGPQIYRDFRETGPRVVWTAPKRKWQRLLRRLPSLRGGGVKENGGVGVGA